MASLKGLPDIGLIFGRETLNQKIIGWIVFCILIVVLMYVLYTIYNIVVNGYSRTWRAALQWKLSNKVDVFKEFGGKNGTLYNALLYLAMNSENEIEFFKRLGYSFAVIGGCDDEDCENVFKHFVYTVDTYYEPEFKENKYQQFLNDYITYHDKITKELQMNGLAAEERISKISYILNSVLDYMSIYSEIVRRESDILCKLIDMKGEARRAQAQKELDAMKDSLKNYLDSYGISKPDLTTSMKFADFFPDPLYIANCGKAFDDIYKDLLAKSGHENLRISVQQIVQNLQKATVDLTKATTVEKKKEAMDSIKKLKLEKLETEKQMARLRKSAVEQATKYKQEEEKSVVGVKKAKKLANGTRNEIGNITYTPGEYKSIIGIDEASKSPLTIARKDRKLNRVYVPCYDSYLHFLTVNKKETYIKNLTKQGMGETDIIAYLFMQDLSKLLQETNESCNNQADDECTRSLQPPFIVRILKMYIAMENVANCVKQVIDTQNSLRYYLNNIFFDLGDNAKLTEIDFARFGERLIVAYYKRDFKELVVNSTYTWYLLELLTMSQLDNSVFEVLSNEIDDLSSGLTNVKDIVEHSQTLNTYMNVVPTKGKVKDSIVVSEPLKEFLLHHPIFSTLYMSAIGSLSMKNVRSNDVAQAKQKAKNLYLSTRSVMKAIFDIGGINVNNFINSSSFRGEYEKLVYVVHSLKQFIIYSHIVHMYFMQYKNIIFEKDKQSQTRYENEGYIELYNEQSLGDKDFYKRLITPFKKDLLDNRVASAWKRTFYGPRFDKSTNISYWREFDGFWIRTIRPKAEKMMQKVWADVGKSAKLRW